MIYKAFGKIFPKAFFIFYLCLTVFSELSLLLDVVFFPMHA